VSPGKHRMGGGGGRVRDERQAGAQLPFDPDAVVGLPMRTPMGETIAQHHPTTSNRGPRGRFQRLGVFGVGCCRCCRCVVCLVMRALSRRTLLLECHVLKRIHTNSGERALRLAFHFLTGCSFLSRASQTLRCNCPSTWLLWGPFLPSNSRTPVLDHLHTSILPRATTPGATQTTAAHTRPSRVASNRRCRPGSWIRNYSQTVPIVEHFP
jgi:hypothetical protein